MFKFFKVYGKSRLIFSFFFLLTLPYSPLFSAIPVPVLTYPFNSEKVSFNREETSTFMWEIDSGKFKPGEYLYDFVIVEVLAGQKPEEAIEKNPPVYTKKGIDNYYLAYPWDAPYLLPADYAWQITAYEKDSKDPEKGKKSKVSSITVTREISIWDRYLKSNQNRYTELKEKLDGSYQMAFDKKVCFKYQELYEVALTQGLRFKIYDEVRRVLVYTDETGNVSPASAAPVAGITTGTQYLIVNLESAPGIALNKYYTLEVWNGKNERWFLRFFTAASNPIISK